MNTRKSDLPQEYFLCGTSYRLNKAGFDALKKTHKFYEYPIRLKPKHLIMLASRVNCPYYIRGLSKRTLCLFSEEQAFAIELMMQNIEQWLETQDDYLY